MTDKIMRRKAHALMFGLIYPAFLGTFLVTVTSSWRQVDQTGLAGWLGFLLLYFASQFVESSTGDPENYKWCPQFIADVAIVGLFSVVFISLSDAGAVAAAAHQTVLPTALNFVCLAITFFLATISRHDPNPPAPFLDRLAHAGIVAAGLGALAHVQVDTNGPIGAIVKAAPGLALWTLWLLLGIYFIAIVVRAVHGEDKWEPAWLFLTDNRWTPASGMNHRLLWALVPPSVVGLIRVLLTL